MKTLFLDFDEEKIITTLPKKLPLFPLDNVVFFPNTIQACIFFNLDKNNQMNLLRIM